MSSTHTQYMIAIKNDTELTGQAQESQRCRTTRQAPRLSNATGPPSEARRGCFGFLLRTSFSQTVVMVLASVLRTQFQRLADMNHGQGVHLSNQSRVAVLDEELELYKEGLRLCADGHPLRILFLFALGKCLLRTGTHVFDFSKGIRHILETLQVEGSPPRQSLEGALESQLEEHDHIFFILLAMASKRRTRWTAHSCCATASSRSKT
jgi:hypothetical protein